MMEKMKIILWSYSLDGVALFIISEEHSPNEKKHVHPW